MILPGLGTLAFLNPWILAGLLFLPALWFLLRVTPPAPRRIVFPAARFLAGLRPEDHAPRKTPWWVLLLRLLCAAFVIMALAGPVLNPAAALPGQDGVRIVIDNGWAAAQTWDAQRREAAALIARAGREKRDLFLLTTAPEPDGSAPVQQGPLAQGQAESILRGLQPRPWASDFDRAAKALRPDTKAASFFLSNGAGDGDPAPLLRALQAQGRLAVLRPPAKDLPQLLRPARGSGTDIKTLVSFTPGTPAGTTVSVQAVGTDGRILDVQTLTVEKTKATAEISFALPAPLRAKVGRLRLTGRNGAGAVLLLDDSTRRRTVGITGAAGKENEAPLVEASFYIRRALETQSDIIAGTPQDLLAKKPDVIILPDTGALPPDEMDALEKWVRGGGLLLRFAGPRMTQMAGGDESFLTPVPLRLAGRAMDGALTWDKPLHLAAFPQTSPLYGLDIPGDLTVRRQILAEPVEGLDKLTWAGLEDGTPLITAKALDHGMLVLIHTTATPEWSDLALSGLFVKIMERTVSLAGSTMAAQTDATGVLQPLLVLDGFGNTGQPGGFVQPVSAASFDGAQPAPAHPPGLYGRAGITRALNAGDRLPALKALDAAPSGATDSVYGGSGNTERDLMPHLLALAFALFCADWLLMMVLQSGFIRQSAVTLLVLFATALPAHAMNEDDMTRFASSLYLAHVRTGAAAIDNTAHAGLEALQKLLTQRTSVEPAGVASVDPAQDDLSFFPFLYWPVAADQAPLSAAVLRNVQSYLDHGGTILFDTRGGSVETLRRMAAGLDIPPLVPMPPSHVLTRSFYLLKDYPDKAVDTVWIEDNSASGRDGVSSVIVTGRDWASVWAGASDGGRAQEFALRFGANMVIYALTGNYKADQVHLPSILERLGQ